MTDLWVARDADGALWWYSQKPEWYCVDGVWDASSDTGAYKELPKSYYPDLKPGECRRLVMAEKEQA